jgi:predicted small lipoprotein YifL
MRQGRRRRARLGTIALFAVTTLAAGAGCGRRGADVPGREVVTPLLQQQADELKRDGEKLDPVLRVKATWKIEGVDVTERPGDADRPWAGTIPFKIRSETKDERGAVAVDEFERRFDYVWMASVKRWVFQMPPSPAP